jgi:hypothetical protein
MPENRFVGDVARFYDRDAAVMFAPERLAPVVGRLAELAVEGPVLEFAIGTGRVALQLAERGLDVTGIELPPSPTWPPRTSRWPASRTRPGIFAPAVGSSSRTVCRHGADRGPAPTRSRSR